MGLGYSFIFGLGHLLLGLGGLILNHRGLILGLRRNIFGLWRFFMGLEHLLKDLLGIGRILSHLSLNGGDFGPYHN